jgi:hypothetical protein
MSTRAIAIIGTPLQLINAIEYLKSSPHEPWSVDLVDISVSTDHRRVIDKTLDFLDFPIRQFYRFPFTRTGNAAVAASSSILNRVAFAFSGIQHPKRYDVAIVGHFSLPVYKYFLRETPKSVVVDDGLFVLSCPERRKKEIALKKPDVITGSLIHRLNHLLWRNSEISSSINWFSRYDIDVPESDTFTRNTLDNLRRSNKTKQNSRDIFFIGMNVVECGILTLTDYLATISSLAEHFVQFRFSYIAKYSESKEVVDSIENILSPLGGQVIRPKVNFEVYLASLEVTPRVIASLYTSALINAMDILGDNSHYISIDISRQNISSRLRESIAQCYLTITESEFFRRCGTKIPFSELSNLSQTLLLNDQSNAP